MPTLPDAVWLYCILPFLDSDRDRVRLLSTCKALHRLLPDVSLFPIWATVQKYWPGQERDMYPDVLQEVQRRVITGWLSWSGDLHRVPRHIVERELAHPVQLL